ncbi:MAG: hypothetical protein LRY54_04975 [Alphaproteobacteria bacterium]|nr:hypothetical protein [Alphaproteobacteria bacterium]
MLDRHTEVHGAGELLHISQIVRGVERDAHKRYPVCMPHCAAAVYAQMGGVLHERGRKNSRRRHPASSTKCPATSEQRIAGTASVNPIKPSIKGLWVSS